MRRWHMHDVITNKLRFLLQLASYMPTVFSDFQEISEPVPAWVSKNLDGEDGSD